MGIIVPPDASRPLAAPDPYQALAQGYPGTALKLGKELWAERARRGRRPMRAAAERTRMT